MSWFDFNHGRAIGRRDARQSPSYTRRVAATQRELAKFARGLDRPIARAYSLGYARGARDVLKAG